MMNSFLSLGYEIGEAQLVINFLINTIINVIIIKMCIFIKHLYKTS